MAADMPLGEESRPLRVAIIGSGPSAFYAAEEKYVLRREWLSVGRIDDVPEPGDFFTITLLGEPLIIVRADDGEIRALSAVCRHRG